MKRLPAIESTPRSAYQHSRWLLLEQAAAFERRHHELIPRSEPTASGDIMG
jgi:hypothetical protein